MPYHYLLWYFFDVRKTFFTAHYPWYWHVLFFYLMGILIFVASLVKRTIDSPEAVFPQTRAANNGRIRYEHPLKNWWPNSAEVCWLSVQGCLWDAGPSVQIGSYIGTLISLGTYPERERKQLLAAGPVRACLPLLPLRCLLLCW